MPGVFIISVPEVLAAARPYVSAALNGEAVLTVGAPLHAWRREQIDAVVSVGPLECMPTKIAEAQFHHVSEREGLLSLTLSFNGDPINTAALDNFAFEIKERFRRKRGLDGYRSSLRTEAAVAEACSGGVPLT